MLHVSDVHFNRGWRSGHDELIRRVGEEKPDLILMTGDLVDDKIDHLPAMPMVLRLAAAMTAPLGCYSILGNHDGDLLGARLTGTPITMIDNDWRRIPVGDASLELVGLPGVHREDLSDQALASYPPKAPGAVRIVLSHYPDHLRKTGSLKPDIFLAGHTHGGQICLPGGVPIIRHDTLPRRYCSGVHRVNDTWLIVNRGFGFAGRLAVRLFCPSEVILFTLRTA